MVHIPVAGRDALGEEPALGALLVVPVLGAQMEVTDMTPLVVVIAMAAEQARVFKSPLSQYPRSPSLLGAEEEDASLERMALGAGVEGSLLMGLVPRKQSMTDKDTAAEEEDIPDNLGKASFFWR